VKVGDKLYLNDLEIEVSIHDHAPKGYMHMAFADCAATIRDGETEIGEIVGCMGGGVELKDRRVTDHPTYFLSTRTLWNAFQRALERASLIEEASIMEPSKRKDSA